MALGTFALSDGIPPHPTSEGPQMGWETYLLLKNSAGLQEGYNVLTKGVQSVPYLQGSSN